MLTVPTALLLHRTASETHHDWLVGTPQYHIDRGSGLWTARVQPASRDWRGVETFDLTVIEPHRRVYLDFQGSLTGGRGVVTRADRGQAVIRLWSRDRIVWDVRMRDFVGPIQARRIGDARWRAGVLLGGL